jgi:spore coat polysaccharide biosynthesis protein SpsF (cytidylyltransferase family)
MSVFLRINTEITYVTCLAGLNCHICSKKVNGEDYKKNSVGLYVQINPEIFQFLKNKREVYSQKYVNA